MRSVHADSRPPVGLAASCLLILLLGTVSAYAQEAGSLSASEVQEEVDTGRARHPYVLALSASASHMIPINILKEEIYDINDLTGAGFGLAADLRVYILDGLCLSVGAQRGGFPLVDNRMPQMADINTRFEGAPINPDNFLRLDGFNVGLTAYFGGKLVSEESRFNPYLRAGVLYMDWALESNGRGSEVISYQDERIEGSDFGAGMGMGTEYRLGEKINLDLSLFWGYVLTGDEIKYEGLQSPVNDSYYWTNTHFWNLTLGLVVGI